jgi:hypothetical protein
MNLIYAGFNYSTEDGFLSAANDFIRDRSVLWDWVQEHGVLLLEWLKQPRLSTYFQLTSGLQWKASIKE